MKDLYSLLFQEVFGSRFEKLVAQGSEENLKFYYFLMGVLEQNITLDSALEIRLTSIFENFNLDDLIFYRVSEYIDSLSSKFQSIYLGKLKDSSNNLQKMNELFNIKNKCNFSALIDIFKNASSFEVANHYGQFLHEYANFFDEDNISELLLAIKNNSQLYCSYIHHYSLPLLYKKTKMYTKIWRDFSKDMEDHVAKNYWAPFLATMNN